MKETWRKFLIGKKGLCARKQKDRFFAVHWQSPIPSEERAKFKGLEYYPPNADYRFELELHEHRDKKLLQSARANFDSKSVMRSARFKCIRATLARNGCLSRSRTQPVVRRPTDRYTQFKEESNAKRSGRPRLVHSFSFFSRNRVEIGGEKNEIAMTCWYERTHV